MQQVCEPLAIFCQVYRVGRGPDNGHAGFLQRQRWAGVRPGEVTSARFADWSLLRAGTQPVFLTIVEATLGPPGREREV